MMKRREMEIFSMSFLDIISCGFGAVVLLVLLAKTDTEQPEPDVALTAALLEQVSAAKEELVAQQDILDLAKRQIAENTATLEETVEKKTRTARTLGEAEKQKQSLEQEQQAVKLAIDVLKRQVQTQKGTAQKPDEEVGGIPVDADYIVFVIDTSGSMRRIWRRVAREIGNILSIHPKVKGFRIMNDQGQHLLSSKAPGTWTRDLPGTRKAAIAAIETFNAMSLSNPDTGIATALRLYAKPGHKLAIYVFGDDYNGTNSDLVAANVAKLNRIAGTNRKKARIHGVGFPSSGSGTARPLSRFAILMSKIARQNDGTFLTMPP